MVIKGWMMAFTSDRNLYPGINAHLNSFLQQPDGGWETFHATHIGDLRAVIDRLLPPNYYAVQEKSLQIGEVGFDFGQTQRTRPDVSIFQAQPSAESERFGVSSTPTLTLPLVLEDENDYLNAVIIYEFEPGNLPGKPVTRIELLSPSNKPPNRDARQYLARRILTLRSGITLVEIDYLHQTPPVNALVPSYPEGDDGAYPYMVLVSRPHPTPEDGYTDFYGFSVDDPLPVITIPLVGNESVNVSLNFVYARTFEGVRVFQMLVDYEQEPLNFQRYRAEDQALIRQRLAEIRRQKL
ncbi:MAG: DUF4058 family protein [Chloroflexota bacterium]